MSCNGLHADIQHVTDENIDAKNKEARDIIQKSYKGYKNEFARNIEFYQDSDDFDSALWNGKIYDYDYVKDDPDLIFIDIFFDTVTYDEIERDVKITMEAALGLIGGTMGLLTGFSILSGVEIVYFGIKFLLSLCSQGECKKTCHEKLCRNRRWILF